MKVVTFALVIWLHCRLQNKTGLQPVSRPGELVHYFGGWVEGASKQTNRTNGGWVKSTFGAKAEQISVLGENTPGSFWAFCR